MITAPQLQILQHSLGVDKFGCGRQYRNRFVTGPESDDWGNCRALVDAGLMADHGAQSMMGGMHCFTVTDAGKSEMQQASPTPPKLTRSQRRYQDFLSEDCGYTFTEWLNLKRPALS